VETKTERLLRYKRRHGGILVPKIEEFMLRPVGIDCDEDVEFLTALMGKMVMRENQREVTPMFSPSALGECLRRVYLTKHHGALEIRKARPMKVEPHFYFLNGNFLHMKWQFVLWKMFQAGVRGIEPLELDTVEPRWCEIPVTSKRKDHGGTADVGLKIFDSPMFIDFKGLNVKTFGEITRGLVPPEYAIQLCDYMHLYNCTPKRPTEEIYRSLLVVENKGGPDTKHHAALHEILIDLDEHKPELKARLEQLRAHEADEEIPPPECTSTRTFQFQGCPFSKFCKEEVRKIERKRAKSKDTEGYKVSVPKRNGDRRARRNSDG